MPRVKYTQFPCNPIDLVIKLVVFNGKRGVLVHELDNVLIDMHMDDYQGNESYSRSDLMLIKQSPYHLRAKKEGIYPKPDKESPSMIMGQLFHCLVLEPHLFDEQFLVMGEMDRRTKAGKELYQFYLDEAKGRATVDIKHYSKARIMADNVLEHEIARKALKGCLIERSLFWVDEETGLNFKCRPDAYNPDNGIVVDLKSTKDAAFRPMQRSCVTYGYFLQAAMIREAIRALGLKFTKFILLCAENSEPYATAPIVFDDNAIDSGLNEFNYLKRILARCIQENRFDHHPLRTMFYPDWAEKDFTED